MLKKFGLVFKAPMLESVDKIDLKSIGESRAGSSPARGTTTRRMIWNRGKNE